MVVPVFYRQPRPLGISPPRPVHLPPPRHAGDRVIDRCRHIVLHNLLEHERPPELLRLRHVSRRLHERRELPIRNRRRNRERTERNPANGVLTIPQIPHPGPSAHHKLAFEPHHVSSSNLRRGDGPTVPPQDRTLVTNPFDFGDVADNLVSLASYQFNSSTPQIYHDALQPHRHSGAEFVPNPDAGPESRKSSQRMELWL